MKRTVTNTRKDRDGDITALCNPAQQWSPVSKSQAISDIKSGIHSYVARWHDGTETPIRVVSGPYGDYLRTDRDTTPRNNLDELPNC